MKSLEQIITGVLERCWAADLRSDLARSIPPDRWAGIVDEIVKEIREEYLDESVAA